MAIVRGIEPGAILLKEIRKERHPKQNPETGRYVRSPSGGYIYEDQDVYYVLKLETRRARTNGALVSGKYFPFLEKIKIRLHHYRWQNNRYTAVGCYWVRVLKEEYEQEEVHPIAQKYYKKLKNRDTKALMTTKLTADELAILRTKKILQEEPSDTSDDKWPEEPHLYQYWDDSASW